METQSQSTPKKRTSKSLARKGLEAIIAQFDELLSSESLSDKPAKRADIVIEKARALKELLALEAEDRATEEQDTIARLEAQHTTDSTGIANLTAENATLRAKAGEVRTVALPDPEAATLREQNTAFSSLLMTIAESLDETQRPQMAIRVIQSCPPATAKVFVQMLGLSYESYAQMLSSYTTERELLDVIERAKCEGPAVIFAKAALAVRDAGAAKGAISRPEPFIPDNRPAEVKLKEAKELVRQTASQRVKALRDLKMLE
jgi:predicted transcriptional regulator